jgi:hypothetical protein
VRPYGVPIEQFPDVGDIQEMGAKSSAGKFPGKSGDYHGYIRNPTHKASIRRRWKRAARAEGKRACKEDE